MSVRMTLIGRADFASVSPWASYCWYVSFVFQFASDTSEAVGDMVKFVGHGVYLKDGLQVLTFTI
jgi:hypothetical protein